MQYQAEVALGNEDDLLGSGGSGGEDPKEGQQLHVIGRGGGGADGSVFSQTATAVQKPLTDFNSGRDSPAAPDAAKKRTSRGGYETLDSDDRLPELSASAHSGIAGDPNVASTRALLELLRMHREAERLAGQTEGFSGASSSSSGAPGGSAMPKVRVIYFTIIVVYTLQIYQRILVTDIV